MITLKNIDETQSFARCIASNILAPASIWLYGELGVGKTVFCREFIRNFFANETVKSPTYTLLETYTLDALTIHHFDFYRITDIEEFKYFDIREYFDNNSICLIEWPENAVAVLPSPHLKIRINYGEEEMERKMSLEPLDQRLMENLKKIC